jgi:hypothetical protein
MFKEGMARSMNFNWCLGEAWPDPLTLPLPEKYLKKNGLISINFFRVYDSKYYLLSLPNKFSRLNYYNSLYYSFYNF